MGVKINNLVIACGATPPIKPNFIIARPCCPFYGFKLISAGDEKGFFDTGVESKRCGLRIIRKDCSCQMEAFSKKIDWEDCEINKEHASSVEEFTNFFNFFPLEFQPESGPWQGIHFIQWGKYVMNNNLPRPK